MPFPTSYLGFQLMDTRMYLKLPVASGPSSLEWTAELGVLFMVIYGPLFESLELPLIKIVSDLESQVEVT